MEITAQSNLNDIERYCHNFFNPQNTPTSPDRDYPPEFLELVERIREWRIEKRASGYISEMVVGLHQYSMATTSTGAPVGWQQIFGDELAAWKRAKFI